MIEQDTVKLLRECDAGIAMGVKSIDDVIDSVDSESFKKRLSECKYEHEELKKDINVLLDKYKDDGKDPNPIAKGMSRIKIEAKLAVDSSDNMIADLITDGCNMGVKSLHKYLNKYKAASEEVKDITKRLINSEEKLAVDIRMYL